ncbi:MAG: hypothetical protein JWP02_403 [Acidimicrobiales bacterium]|nr:hypothetical protein [Acidimicrobiales bacterium]
MTRARVVRWVVIAVCVVGIAGMIVGSVGDDNAVALTFGLVTAAAVACLMVATAVSPPATGSAVERVFDERQAARVEELIQRLVDGGAPEEEVRRLVGEAVRLGRDRPSGREIPQIGAPDADY